MKKVIIFFGPPGSGKGTQSDMLGEKLALPVISPGELLRHERDAGTELGKKVADKMAKGELVPDDLVENILDERLEKDDTKFGFILDGFPRDIDQLEYLEEKFKKILNKDDEVAAVYIDLSDKEVKFRIGGRRVCDCGAAYHLAYKPTKKEGICDLCGAAIYIREDDKPEVMANRLNGFHKRIGPILEIFQKKGNLIKIDGEKDIEVIKNEISNLFCK